MRDVWIEIHPCVPADADRMSHPMRDVWIEIMTISIYATKEDKVTSHAGCVD